MQSSNHSPIPSSQSSSRASLALLRDCNRALGASHPAFHLLAITFHIYLHRTCCSCIYQENADCGIPPTLRPCNHASQSARGSSAFSASFRTHTTKSNNRTFLPYRIVSASLVSSNAGDDTGCTCHCKELMARRYGLCLVGAEHRRVEQCHGIRFGSVRS